jgi:hypothetical protein
MNEPIILRLTEAGFAELVEKASVLAEPERTQAMRQLKPLGEQLLARREELRRRILGDEA